MDCPVCGTQISEFQTKDGPGVFDTIEFQTVDNFHAICRNCQSFVEFYYSPDKEKRNIGDYKIRIVQLSKYERN